MSQFDAQMGPGGIGGPKNQKFIVFKEAILSWKNRPRETQNLVRQPISGFRH